MAKKLKTNVSTNFWQVKTLERIVFKTIGKAYDVELQSMKVKNAHRELLMDGIYGFFLKKKDR